MTEQFTAPSITLLENVTARARQRFSGPEADEAEAFIRAYYRHVTDEDIGDEAPDDLYGAALSLWLAGREREPGQPIIRVFNPDIAEHGWRSDRTVIEIVNDDMPFLVDSVAAELTRQGHEVYRLVHPVVTVCRDEKGRRTALAGLEGDSRDGEKTRAAAPGAVAESLMHIEIARRAASEDLRAVEAGLARVLHDVRAAVTDWPAMMAALDRAMAELEGRHAPTDDATITESIAFLEWLRENHFTFLGFRDYALEGSLEDGKLETVAGSGLGILRDPAVHVLASRHGLTALSQEILHALGNPDPLIITKANVRATVHRPVHMDYIGVKKFDEMGSVTGEFRFIGLFTSAAYNRVPEAIPRLRRKVAQVLEISGFSRRSHDGKALLNILDTYPRDELFQISAEELARNSVGILKLHERPRVGVFLRRDVFERFVSAIVFVPKERFDTTLRDRIAEILKEAFHGRLSASYSQLGDGPLAREHYIIGTTPGAVPEIAPDEVGRRVVAAAESWRDGLRASLVAALGEERGHDLFACYCDAFRAAYPECFTPEQAAADIDVLETASRTDRVTIKFYRLLEDPPERAHAKLYSRGAAIPLSDCLPVFENLGFRVIDENPHTVHARDREPALIDDFTIEEAAGLGLDMEGLKDRFEVAFDRIWYGAMANDGFNRLILRAGLDWRAVVVLRAYARYLRQTGMTFSQTYLEDTLVRNAAIARLIWALFDARFSLAAGGHDDPGRKERTASIENEIKEALEGVASLDEDRIIRRFRNLVRASVRTNFYQTDASGAPLPQLSLKLASGEIDDLPLPRPHVEIFVYSPRVEGVHLRGGNVARGGLRWSDRPEDYRTEILGLMKAQQVKNAVIVPVGAKGGFVPQRLPTGDDRDAFQTEGVESYRMFIRGLLDITDNISGESIVPPRDVVRYDGDDPYLVVAADKGTASFSDIANEISREYGFWLGDAFASGGSQGYDHKKMAITARGAWESVKRHFREMGRNIETEPFTVIGVGDMSGDVFGNGMLLARETRLLAAFDHRHIFVDPDPDARRSHDERKRLFDLPRSSWADYDAAIISAGGGVFARSAKSITLSDEMRALLGIDAASLTPQELIRAILVARADLLWLGGIGTYVKASSESQAEVGDRANDALRIDARDLRVEVVGEGGNLGVTQRGRIEFARSGGRINTDAIDNSAGVDCSDHEVNIKILLDAIVEEGELTERQRNRLLEDMTDEVAAHVLVDNYRQTAALSVAEARASETLEAEARLIRRLEKSGRLDRPVEMLPADDEIADRLAAGHGLTRPEMAVLLAYAKMDLFDEILRSDATEDIHLENDLFRAFPQPLQERFPDAIRRHRLRREIIATRLANSIVNRAGVTLLYRIRDEMPVSVGDVVRAYVATVDVFSLRALWDEIDALDNRVPAAAQTAMVCKSQDLLLQGILWFIRREPMPLDIRNAVETIGLGVAALGDALPGLLTEFQREAVMAVKEGFVGAGVADALASRIACLEPLASAADIVQVANALGREVTDVARVYFTLGTSLGLDWLRAGAEAAKAEDHWDTLAVDAIVDDLFGQQRAIAEAAIQMAPGLPAGAAAAHWLEENGDAVRRNEEMLAELRATGPMTVAKLTFANRQIRGLIAQGGLGRTGRG